MNNSRINCDAGCFVLLRKDVNGNVMDPPMHESPEHAMRKMPDGSSAEMKSLLADLRRLNIEDRLIVYDPVSWRILTSSDILFIGINGPAILISLNPGWWGSLEETKTRQECLPGFVAFYEDLIADDPFINSVKTSLESLLRDDRLVVWDPDSRKLLSAPLISKICVNGDSVQICLAEDWPMDFGVRAVLETCDMDQYAL